MMSDCSETQKILIFQERYVNVKMNILISLSEKNSVDCGGLLSRNRERMRITFQSAFFSVQIYLYMNHCNYVSRGHKKGIN